MDDTQPVTEQQNVNVDPLVGTRRLFMPHDIKKLPVWAQKLISDLEHKIGALNGLKEAHALLIDHDREWFTVPNNAENPFRLWRFHHDMPTAVCSLSDKDVLLVGRATKDKTYF